MQSLRLLLVAEHGPAELWRLVAEYEEGDDEIPEPPMEWIEALAKSANTQAYRPISIGLALPPLEVPVPT